MIATRNKGKILEFTSLLGLVAERIISLDEIDGIPEIKETGGTFRENALIKARTVMEAAGKTTLADDSGLVVEALGGQPGVHSARYSGLNATDKENIDKLLEELKEVENREASFVCCLALVIPGGKEIVVEGRCEGMILDIPRGTGGFGYDPVFFLPEKDVTMAELSSGEKNLLSHRAKASKALMMYMNGHKEGA